MPSHIVLLTGAREAPFLRDYLLDRNPNLTVHTAGSLPELDAVLETAGRNARLIAFLTDVIVPARLLAELIPEPYNIHPGPPDIPGVHPEAFAIWTETPQFGVTAHRITAEIDSGPIVHCARFDMPEGIARRDLADMTFPLAINAFRLVADHCAVFDTALPRVPESWGGLRRTRRAFATLCARYGTLSGAEAARLVRACGEALPDIGVQSGPITA